MCAILVGMEIRILYQDDELLVVNKPPNVVVNIAESVKEETVQDFVDQNFDWELAHDTENRNGIVHRLDKDTSGVMLLAKTKSSQTELQRQFHDRETKKTYITLVHGKLEPKEGFMTLPMARNIYDRQSFAVNLSGKLSFTAYKVVGYYVPGDALGERRHWENMYARGFTLVEAYPKTGRTHQIRVFFKHLGYSLVGDAIYTSEKMWKLDNQWCGRQFLHARELCFVHPTTHESMCIEAPLTDDLLISLDKLQKKED